jgi:methylated-DNA-protein-cysteine methyltransferase-like protein
MSFNNKVYEIVCQIPEGQVATYGQIAFLAGNRRASRAVGYALHRNPHQHKVPCHRVVFKDGSLTDAFCFGGKILQRQLLEGEGVQFTEDGRVDMRLCSWSMQVREQGPGNC